MKAIVHHEIGKPSEVLKVVERPTPAPSEGEALVRVLAAPIHPSNLLRVSGRYGVQPELPATPGSEGVGEVIEVGEGVRDLKVGQRVLLTARVGTWCTKLVAPAHLLVPVPADADVEQLAMLVINPLTAHLMLHTLVKLQAGEWLVQSAANSAVGQYLIQLAKIAGIRTVNVVRRDSVAPQLEALGADAVVMSGPELSQRIRDATSGAPIRLAVDAVAGDMMSALIDSLAPGGTVVSYGAMSMEPASVHPARLIFDDLRVRGFWLSKWFETATASDRRDAFSALIPLVASGQLHAAIDSRFPLEEIVDAARRASTPGRDGKVLLVPKHD